MKIIKFLRTLLHNETHFEFYYDFRALAEACGIDKLNIANLFVIFLALFADEDTAMQKIRKSAHTAKLQAADKYRDEIWRGLVDAVKSALNHFNSSVRDAATTLKIVCDTYGNIAKKTLDDETGAIYNIIQDMRGKYAAEVAALGLTDWVNELEKANEAFRALMKERYDETAEKTTLTMKDVRVKIDEAYDAIVERINAAIIIEGEDNYREFVTKLNVLIKRYADIQAQRKGRAAAKKEKSENKE
jgi:gas vesicle protein